MLCSALVTVRPSEAVPTYERSRADDPELAGELMLLTPDEIEVVAHTALEFGQ